MRYRMLNKDEITSVIQILQERGYDAKNQIVGYLISNDLGYIPDFDDNRNKMATIDRMIILEEMMSEYLK